MCEGWALQVGGSLMWEEKGSGPLSPELHIPERSLRSWNFEFLFINFEFTFQMAMKVYYQDKDKNIFKLTVYQLDL